jgi:hypothetical protein
MKCHPQPRGFAGASGAVRWPLAEEALVGAAADADEAGPVVPVESPALPPPAEDSDASVRFIAPLYRATARALATKRHTASTRPPRITGHGDGLKFMAKFQ